LLWNFIPKGRQMEKIEYLGDGVYCVFDGYGLELRANDHANPTDKIYLEPSVLDNLIRYYAQFKKGE